MDNNADVSILLAEDDDIDRENIKRAFKKHGIENPLHIAKDGQEAYDLLTGENGVEKLETTPKILLLDVNMPRMNGLELLQAVRQYEQLRRCSVFILTTSDNGKDISMAYDYNVAGYMLKPLQVDRFLEVISVLNQYWSFLGLTH